MTIEFEVFKRLHYDISSVFLYVVTLEKDVSTDLLCGGETAADEENSCLAAVTKSRLCLLIDLREEGEEIIRFSIAIK